MRLYVTCYTGKPDDSFFESSGRGLAGFIGRTRGHLTGDRGGKQVSTDNYKDPNSGQGRLSNACSTGINKPKPVGSWEIQKKRGARANGQHDGADKRLVTGGRCE